MKYLFFLLFSSSIFASHHVRSADLNELCSINTSVYRHVSASLKSKVYFRDGISGGNHTGLCAGKEGCEIDHRVSLKLGGSNDISNLMIQPYTGTCNAHQKDILENKLHRLSCKKIISLSDAQNIIYTDWESAYKYYINPKGCN